MNVHYFDSIRVEPPVRRIYTRLGYRSNKTRLSSRQQNMLDGCISEGLSLLNIKGAAVRVKITELKGNDLFLAEGSHIRSKGLAKLLMGCSEALIMAATGGPEIVEKIRELSVNEGMTNAVVFDAFASETVDAALDWIVSFFRYELKRENLEITKRRFSAGYGDLTLDNQEMIYNILRMDKLGVHLTESYLMKPEKTVTALAGIKQI